MKGQLSDGAEYRVIRCSDADDPRVHALSHGAFRVKTMLRLLLPPTGLGTVYVGALSDQCRMSRDGVGAALDELEAAGFLRRHQLQLLLVDAFGSEPNLNAENANHQKFIRRLVATVGDSPLVEDFRSTNPEWFPETIQMVSGDHPDPAAKPAAVAVAKPATASVPAAAAASAADAASAASRANGAGRPAAAATPGMNGRRASAPDGARALRDAAPIVAMVNRLIAVHWPHARPIGERGAVLALDEMASHGVPPDFVATAITDWFDEKCNPENRPPTSLGYFTDAVVERWNAVAMAGAADDDDFDSPEARDAIAFAEAIRAAGKPPVPRTRLGIVE